MHVSLCGVSVIAPDDRDTFMDIVAGRSSPKSGIVKVRSACIDGVSAVLNRLSHSVTT